MNAPLRDQSDLAKLQLAALPTKGEESGVDEIDADAFGAAVLDAWSDQPLDERRSALARLLRQVPLSPGGVKITCGYCHHDPSGPPKGSSARYRVRVEAEGVRRPRARDHGASSDING